MCFRMGYGLTLAAVCLATGVWASAICVTLSYTPPSGPNTCDGFVTQDRMILVTAKAPVVTRTNQMVYVNVAANQTHSVRVKTTMCCPAYRRVNNSCMPNFPHDHTPHGQALPLCVVVIAFIIRWRCHLLGYQSRVVRWHSDHRREIPDSLSPHATCRILYLTY